MDFDSFMTKKDTKFEAVLQSLKKENQYNQTDKRFWNLAKDDTGKGSATFKFIPSKDGEYWVQLFSHNYKNEANGKFLIQTCPTTIGGQCPICDDNRALWNSDPDTVRQRKRKVKYISNIYVVSDPLAPENEGKIFLFEYGVKIFEKLSAQMHPEFAEDPKVNPFDFLEGKNFKFRSKKQQKFFNYDDSTFGTDNVFAGFDSKKLKAIYETTYELKPFVAADQFKSYDELKTLAEKVNGSAGTPAPAKRVAANDASNQELDDEIPDHTTSVPKKKAPAKKEADPVVNTSEDDDEFLKDLENLLKE